MFNLSRISYYADFVLMPAFIGLVLAYYLGPAFVLAALSGFVAWTLAEYLIHRFVFHRVPYLRREHDRHHADPSAYIGVSSLISGSILLAVWMMARLIFETPHADAALLGFAAGYCAYIVAHDQFHHGALRPGDLLYRAARRHALHHRGSELNFGVIVPWWDMMFRTYRR